MTEKISTVMERIANVKYDPSHMQKLQIFYELAIMFMAMI